jgi:AraC-like DNA-binding protein
MSRPKVSIDFQQAESLMRMKPSLADTAAFFHVSEDTIERIIVRECGLSFVKFRERHMVHCRHELIRKAFSMAMEGDKSMLALCLKHMCGWNDSMHEIEREPVMINLAYKI